MSGFEYGMPEPAFWLQLINHNGTLKRNLIKVVQHCNTIEFGLVFIY